MTASNTVFTVFSAIGLVLSLIPFWWHLESWNVGTCMFMIWTALACLVFFVDSILWSGNTTNWAPVWCDFAVRIQIGIAIAWPACALCIIHRLHNVTSSTSAPLSTSRNDKRREVVIDLLIAVGIPLLGMGLEYIVAGHRFSIIEDIGCFPATLNIPLTYVLVWSWPLIIGVISACYGALTIRSFIKRRRDFMDLLSANTNLTYSRYWRLIAMSSADFCLTIPLAIKTIITNALLCPAPSILSVAIHSDRSLIVQVPRSQLEQIPGSFSALEFTRWSAVLSALVFFGFFGFANEAMRNYRLLASTVTKRVRHSTFTQSTAITGSMTKHGSAVRGTLPASTTQKVELKSSFSDRLSIATVVGEDDLGALSHLHKAAFTSFVSHDPV